MVKIIYSGLRTPDGTLLESRTRHDYVVHQDQNGKAYMLDGGIDYIRSSANGDEEFITITLDDPHEVVREYVQWGTRGKNGDQPLRYVKLKDMETDHIEAVLNLSYVHPNIAEAMKTELEFRNE